MGQCLFSGTCGAAVRRQCRSHSVEMVLHHQDSQKPAQTLALPTTQTSPPDMTRKHVQNEPLSNASVENVMAASWQQVVHYTMQLERQARDSTQEGIHVLAKCVQVIDGDTIRIAYWNRKCNRCEQYKVRLDGIDTPELHPKKIATATGRKRSNKDMEREKCDAQRARHHLEEILARSQCGPMMILVRFGKNDKYGRPLARIYTHLTTIQIYDYIYGTHHEQLQATLLFEQSVNHEMIIRGLAKPYHGGAKT